MPARGEPDILLSLSLQNASGGKITSLKGGVPILISGQVVGAIGVGGGTGEQDVEVAKAGIHSASRYSRREEMIRPRLSTGQPPRYKPITHRYACHTHDPDRRTFVASSVALAGTLAAGQAQSKEVDAPLIAYVGTFSSPLKDVLPTQVDLPPGNGRGIHIFRVDRATGAMTAAGVHEMGTSPSCLAVNAAGTRLYSANETDRAGRREGGHGQRLRHRPGRRALKLLNTVRSGGAGPTYVSLHPSGQVPAGGQLLRRLGRGAADPRRRPAGRRHRREDRRRQGRPHEGGPRPAGQLRLQRARPDARAHDPGRSGRPVRAARRPGPGQDLRLEVRREEGHADRRTTRRPSSLPPGDGPRHFHFHPNGRWLYSIQEEGSTVVLFDYDADDGRLTARQTISTLPPGFAGSNFCSEILVSADGRFVYAGNRLHDSIGDLLRRPGRRR